MSTVLKSLGLPISFDAGKMNAVDVHLKKQFSTAEQALQYLAGRYGLELIRHKQVWIIQQSEKHPPGKDIPKSIHIPVDTLSQSRSVNLEPVVIVPSPSQMRMQIGETSGEIGVYQNLAKSLPGSSDNTIYTLLRLMPGIRASGEPTQDVMVRGSGMGETGICLGTMSLFGFQSYYDHISFVNPYMIKEIRLHYAQHDVSGSSQSGGMVEILGIQPLLEKNQFKMSLTNNTMNLFANTRKENWGVSVGFRQSLGNTFSSGTISAKEGEETQFMVIPDFNFADINLKTVAKFGKKDLLQFEAYGISSTFATTLSVDQLEYAAKEEQSQGACALSYQHKGRWGKLILESNYTGLEQKYDNLHWYAIGEGYGAGTAQAKNTFSEWATRLKYRLDWNTLHTTELGLRYSRLESEIPANRTDLNLFSLYAKDQITFTKLNFDAALRMDFTNSPKVYIQPHIRVRYDISPFWTTSITYDINNQFMGRAPFQNDAGGWNNLWNAFYQSPMHSTQSSVNLSYTRFGWLFNGEVYYSAVRNVHRLLETYDPINDRWNATAGIGDSYRTGLEFFAKKHYAQYETFISYHLNHSEGIFNETGQEIKWAGLIDWGDWTISTDFINGFGYKYPISQLALISSDGTKDLFPEHQYSRWDAALKYRYRTPWMQLQAGCSILNILNTQNVKYQYNNERINKVASVFAQASPRMILFHLEILFESK